MTNFFQLISVTFDSVLFGMLLAVITMALLYFLLYSLSKTCVKTVPFYITGVILAPLLVVQDSFMVAAFKVKNMIEGICIEICQIVGNYNQNLNMKDTQDILDQVVENNPIVGIFFNITNIEVDNAQNFAQEISDIMNNELNTFIAWRIGWCVVSIIIAVIVAMLADKKAIVQPSSRRNGRSSSVTRSSHRHRY